MIIIKKISPAKLRKEILLKIKSCGYAVENKNASWFVAYIDKKYAGFGGFWKLMGSVAYIGPTFVKEEFRGQGVHTALIKERINYAGTLNVEKIWSRCNLDNIPSARNLIRCGFNLDKPKIIGILDTGNYSISLDDYEIMEADKNELFFSMNL